MKRAPTGWLDETLDRVGLTKRSTGSKPAGRWDRMAWIAYPTAGKLGTDLNRDILVRLAEQRGIQPVRQIAINETWSAAPNTPGEGRDVVGTARIGGGAEDHPVHFCSAARSRGSLGVVSPLNSSRALGRVHDRRPAIHRCSRAD